LHSGTAQSASLNNLNPYLAPVLLVDARDLVGVLAVERYGVGVKVLALALDKSQDGVNLWLRRAARRRNEDQGFAQRLEDLDRRLAASLAGESDRLIPRHDARSVRIALGDRPARIAK
jgi:hypothetical protein